MDFLLHKLEALLRLSASLVLILTVSLVGADTQTKVVFFIPRKVTFNDLQALQVLVYASSGAAAYNLIQIGRLYASWNRFEGKSNGTYKYLAWSCYLLDQIIVYFTFAANSAATQNSYLVVTGINEFQWTKWCNIYTRFCFQIGGAVFTGYVASLLMASMACISAFNLFRLYSPQKFLCLKTI